MNSALASFTPKKSGWGDYKWTSCCIIRGDAKASYALVGTGTRGRVIETSEGLVEIQQTPRGWELWIAGELEDTYPTRVDAKFVGYEYLGK